MSEYKIFRPAIQKGFKSEIAGFDAETYGKLNKFYCASVYSRGKAETFCNPDLAVRKIKSLALHNFIIASTNLAFDFFCLFSEAEKQGQFNLLFRQGNLLSAKSYLNNGELSQKYSKKKVVFIDTLNYAHLSVDNLGKLLNIPKLKKPEFLGKLPKTEAEEQELIIYNQRDAEISAKALEFFKNSFMDLGASFKPTIASSAMSLFRNKYQKMNYFNHEPVMLHKIFAAYSGGRTEAFARGKFENFFYYDINSMYPDVMANCKYPNPNTIRHCRKNNIDLIYDYAGFSDCDISVPDCDYPLLPLKYANKLLFPVGNFRGNFSHIELIEAIKRGAVIKNIHETIYFKETCSPFADYVGDLYKLKKLYKKENNPMELPVKLLLNSLYGKFAQKFDAVDNWIPMPEDFDDLVKLDIIEIKGKYCRIKKSVDPAPFCFPEWSAYVTAHARLKLHSILERSGALYCDTDSIFTYKKMPESEDLGALKLEMKVDEGIIIKPKLYAIKGETGEYCKMKGCTQKFNFTSFQEDFLKNRSVAYQKFMRYRESIRRNLSINEIIDVIKAFDLEDNKRQWKNKFSLEQEFSKPVVFPILQDTILLPVANQSIAAEK